MFQRFFPDLYIRSAYHIDYEAYYQKGYRGVIFDIDNTLVTHGAPANEKSIALMKQLHTIGFSIMLLSNNKEPRVKLFQEAIPVPVSYIYQAGKPGVKGYQEAMRRLETTRETTLFVGDQLFTDVWGARNAGIYSILTVPIDKKEEIQIVLKRVLEKPILAAYKRSCKREHREYLLD